MNCNLTYELSIVPNPDTFERLLNTANVCECDEAEDKYIDMSFADKDMLVSFSDSGYKKQIRIVFVFAYDTSEEPEAEQIVLKMRKRIRKYFDETLDMNDFTLTRLIMSDGLEIKGGERPDDYLTVLRRIGNVKGFTMHAKRVGKRITGLHWYGNSNATDILADSVKGKSNAGDVLRLEVQLQKNQAIREYTKEEETTAQILQTLSNTEAMFVTLLSGVIPFGRFLKKADAIKRVRDQVLNDTLRQKMVRILELIPEKKSLKSAMKASGYRNLKDIILTFARIDLSPVTISKRMSVRKMENLYMYL